MCVDLWPVTEPPKLEEALPLTTVMQWDSYTSREYQGVSYGMKSKSFGPYENLPSLVAPQTMELAMTGDDAARLLAQKGWLISNPLQVTANPWLYQAYLQRSLGEWSVAKHGYVTTNCGWFSERSCCYMASGRPVVVQDTGFSNWLPCGEGLIAYTNVDEAVAGIREVLHRYPQHCAAARALMETHFESGQVLQAMLDGISWQ
ncbi:MAG: hypothetical protein HC898_00585 [Phycisphaerales bacterium]|nr:hypothetical protein [Phycisphaerales bacterium]